MNGPPTDIPANQLWAQLQEIPRPSLVVDFPRVHPLTGKPIVQIRIWVLTQEERLMCAVAAEKQARKFMPEAKKEDLGYEDFYSRAMEIEILWRACRDFEDLKKPVFPTPKLMGELLTTEELAMLFRNYLTAQVELGPFIHRMTDAELEAWIDRIAEGGTSFPFDSMHSDLQKILVLTMARQLRPSPTGTSSASSPPDDTSPGTDVSDDDEVEAVNASPRE